MKKKLTVRRSTVGRVFLPSTLNWCYPATASFDSVVRWRAGASRGGALWPCQPGWSPVRTQSPRQDSRCHCDFASNYLSLSSKKKIYQMTSKKTSKGSLYNMIINLQLVAVISGLASKIISVAELFMVDLFLCFSVDYSIFYIFVLLHKEERCSVISRPKVLIRLIGYPY